MEIKIPLLLMTLLAYLGSFVLSIKSLNSLNVPEDISNFFWYSLVGVLLVIMNLLESINGIKAEFISILTVFSLLFHYCFLGVFILKQIKGRKTKRLTLTIFALFYIFTNFGIEYEIRYANLLGFFVPSAGLFLLSVLYFLDLFKNIPENPFWSFGSFWIISGVTILTLLNIPPYLFSSFLNHLRDAYTLLSLINASAYILLHLFIMKGILCHLKKQT